MRPNQYLFQLLREVFISYFSYSNWCFVFKS